MKKMCWIPAFAGMTHILLAFQFLTVFPIRIRGTIREKDLSNSMRYYPLVGAILGGVSALLYEMTRKLFSPMVAVVSAVIGLVLLSGALHVDGFADMCDGFYGGKDRARILAIMKDSHVGTMAIVGVFCLLALKIALLESLDSERVISVLVVIAMMGRWSMVWLCARSTYARSEGGTATPYIGHVNQTTFWTATLFCMGLSFFLLRTQGLAAFAFAAGIAWIFRRYTVKRIGGMTGDTVGACSELVEVLVLAFLSIHPLLLGS